MQDFWQLLARRLADALMQVPTAPEWSIFGIVAVVTGSVVYWYGARSRFLVRASPLPRVVRHRIVATVWLAPALVEETLFRVLPLPHPNENLPGAHVLAWTLLALAGFVLTHPLRTWIKPSPKNAVFTDMRFLVLATGLGLGCTTAYLCTGSLWPSCLLHTVLVVVWLTRYGGWQRIGR